MRRPRSETGPGTAAWRCLAVAALLAHVVLAAQTAARHSAVFDEVVYPTSGYAYLTSGDFRMNPEHPPFLKLWTALPWLGRGVDVRTVDGWYDGAQWTFGRALLYGPAGFASGLPAARWMSVFLSICGGVAVWAVARRLAGEAAGGVAATLWAFDPLVLAHGSLATTDLGAAVLYFGAAVALGPAVTRGGTARLAAASALAGLAWASKFSTLPLVAVGATVVAIGGESTSAADRARRLGLWLVGAATVTVACYGFHGPLPYLEGLRRLVVHEGVGHPSYAFGTWTDTGRWWFFPAAWAVKTPIPILLLSLAGVVVAARRWRDDRVAWGVLLVAPALLGAAALASSLNLGVRHLLPLTPFLAVAGGVAATAAIGRFRRAGVAGVLLSLAWLVAGTSAHHPHHLAYGNEIVGGTAGIRRVLADSNVDWGQDLPALAGALADRPVRRLYLSYFGTAEPSAHGIRYRTLPAFGMASRRFDDVDPSGVETWLAISATSLLDVYAERHDLHAWLRERAPDRTAGGSILLYDLTGDAPALARLGRGAMRLGDPEAAVGPLADALALRPDEGEWALDRARCLAALGRFDEALAACEGPAATVDRDDWCARIREAAAEAAQ